MLGIAARILFGIKAGRHLLKISISESTGD
jgi:hypothetical protein